MEWLIKITLISMNITTDIFKKQHNDPYLHIVKLPNQLKIATIRNIDDEKKNFLINNLNKHYYGLSNYFNDENYPEIHNTIKENPEYYNFYKNRSMILYHQQLSQLNIKSLVMEPYLCSNNPLHNFKNLVEINDNFINIGIILYHNKEKILLNIVENFTYNFDKLDKFDPYHHQLFFIFKKFGTYLFFKNIKNSSEYYCLKFHYEDQNQYFFIKKNFFLLSEIPCNPHIFQNIPYIDKNKDQDFYDTFEWSWIPSIKQLPEDFIWEESSSTWWYKYNDILFHDNIIIFLIFLIFFIPYQFLN